MPPTKSPYPPEFRREAVQLTRTSERSIAEVARRHRHLDGLAGGLLRLSPSRSSPP